MKQSAMKNLVCHEKVKNSGHGFQGLGGFVLWQYFLPPPPQTGGYSSLARRRVFFLLYAILVYEI